MIQASAPGKLFIAGEYAVVEHGHPAILVAIDRFITVSIEPTEAEGMIISKQYAHLPLKWKRINNRLTIEKRENPYHYILEAINVVEQYALEQKRPLQIYNLHVDSQLDSQEGSKYGLGSSGGVTIATIKALFRLYELEENDNVIFKLASLAHLHVGSNGSFGDLAASIKTGWLAYQSFDRQKVLKMSQEMSLSELVKQSWPSLLIEPLSPLTEYELIIGWTKRPASTPSLVDKVQKESDIVEYQNFLKESKAIVNQMIEGFKNNQGDVVLTMIDKNRRLLKSLNPSIETAELTKLIESANDYGSAKTSGAGGGDCGIVLVDKAINLNELFVRWENNNIEKLDLKVYDKFNKQGRTD